MKGPSHFGNQTRATLPIRQLFILSPCLFQIELDKIVTHRNSIYERLSQPVATLDDLNKAFELLQELGDMENTIDDVYLPVENIYADLR